ncbi:MAG: DNA polymerase I [Chloroflexi bacterium]|nr:DNA polymerase I [Chloroflexota bacterium]
MERLMLLDGNGLIYRGYFALPPLSTAKGELVNAVFGFTSILLRGFTDVKPDYVAVAFDLPGPTFRHEEFREYKATRKPMPDDLRSQFPKVREVVAALRIPVLELAGYEADDVIGTLTRQAEGRGVDSTVVTGDLDMLQLVSDRVRLMTTRQGVQNTVYYDPATIHERYGLAPGQMVDFKALKGDSTDNIPGIPGVGEKTAAKLIADFGGLDALYVRLDEVKQEKLRSALAEHREQVFRSRHLATIVRDLPVELDYDTARIGDYDREAVVRLFRELEFRSLIDRLPAREGESADEAAAAARAARDAGMAAAVVGEAPEGWRGGRPAPARPARGPSYDGGLQLSLDFDVVSGGAGAVAEATGSDEAPADATRIAAASSGRAAPPAPLPERTPAEALRAAVADAPATIERVDPAGPAAAVDLAAWLGMHAEVGVSVVGVVPGRGEEPPRFPVPAAAFAVAGPDGRVVAANGPDASSALRSLVEASGAAIVAHEAKPVVAARFAGDAGGPATPVAFDTQIAAYILNASLRSQSIDDVVLERLGLVLPPPAASLVPPHRAGIEAAAALAVRGPLDDALIAEGLDRLYREIELPLVAILARMEAAGVAIDLDALASLDAEFGAELARLEDEIYGSVGHRFDLGSPKQLQQVLFFELDLPKGKKTKTGYSTDASVLEELRTVHPMVGALLDWRMYSKLRSTYVQALPTLVSPFDGRLHTTFHQAVAATGRLSSSDPNLQNIPIRSDLGRRIRRAFVAGDPGLVLLAADYSQIELRILAHVSGDAHLREAFAEGVDIHRRTAALVLHKEEAAVTKDERAMAKMVNFGIAYGMSDYGLSSRANIPREEAKAFIDRYFATYSGISQYMLHIREVAAQQGYVTTLLGRRREIPELRASNPNLRQAGERMAINMPIQGTAADIVKIAMIRLDRRLREGGFRSRMLLQVHDELVLEVPRDEVEAVAPVVRETMETALPLDVPLDVDVRVGDDWQEMTSVGAVGSGDADAGGD